MPAKKKQEFGAKSAFVRSLPANTPAADVVAQAAKKGLKITTGLVYNIRSSSNLSKAKKVKSAPKPGARKGRGGRRAAGGNAEVQLRNAIAALGLVKSREILATVEAAFAGR